MEIRLAVGRPSFLPSCLCFIAHTGLEASWLCVAHHVGGFLLSTPLICGSVVLEARSPSAVTSSRSESINVRWSSRVLRSEKYEVLTGPLLKSLPKSVRQFRGYYSMLFPGRSLLPAVKNDSLRVTFLSNVSPLCVIALV